MNNSLSVIAVTSQKEKLFELQILINSFLAQTDSRWKLYIVHDGPSENCKNFVNSYHDQRIHYRESPAITGNFGNLNRKWILDEITTKWVSWTNGDNYHMPKFVEFMLNKGNSENLDLVLCDCIHNGHPDWIEGVQRDGRGEYSTLYVNKVDLNNLYPNGLGLDFVNFICLTNLAQEISKPPYEGWEQAIADNLFLTELVKKKSDLKYGQVNAVLAVHN